MEWNGQDCNATYSTADNFSHRLCVKYIFSGFKTTGTEEKIDTKSIPWLLSSVLYWGKTHTSGVQHTKYICLQHIITKTRFVFQNLCLIMFIQFFHTSEGLCFKKESIVAEWLTIFHHVSCHIFLPFFLKWPKSGNQALSYSSGWIIITAISYR